MGLKSIEKSEKMKLSDCCRFLRSVFCLEIEKTLVSFALCMRANNKKNKA